MKVGEIVVTNTGVRLQATANLITLINGKLSCAGCYLDKLRQGKACVVLQRSLGITVNCTGDISNLDDSTSLIVVEVKDA